MTGNPVISPDPSSVFACPMTGQEVHWEESDTLNPAAVVKAAGSTCCTAPRTTPPPASDHGCRGWLCRMRPAGALDRRRDRPAVQRQEPGGRRRRPVPPADAYCAGRARFDNDDPTRLIDRLDTPFLIPEAGFEKSGQYPAGAIFIEGLVHFEDTWFLYYGAADSHVGVAVSDSVGGY